MEVLIDDGRFLSLSKKNTKSSTKKNIFFYIIQCTIAWMIIFLIVWIIWRMLFLDFR